MNEYRVALDARYDRRKQASFLFASVVIWLLVLLYLVARDPCWRFFNQGRTASVEVASPAAPWVRLDRKLVERLQRASDQQFQTLDEIEAELVAAVAERRAREGGGPVIHQGDAFERVREIARQRAAERREDEGGGPVSAALLAALRLPDRLGRATEVWSVQPRESAAVSQYGEILDRWANTSPTFGAVLSKPDSLIVAAGAVSVKQETSLAVVVVESFILFEEPLPAICSVADSLVVRGMPTMDDTVDVYLKGPKDASFRAIPVVLREAAFEFHLKWMQGPGLYGVRAGTKDALSDIRPLIVE